MDASRYYVIVPKGKGGDFSKRAPRSGASLKDGRQVVYSPGQLIIQISDTSRQTCTSMAELAQPLIVYLVKPACASCSLWRESSLQQLVLCAAGPTNEVL